MCCQVPAHPADVELGQRLVITLRVVIYPADRDVVPADDFGKLGFGVNVRPFEQQSGAGGEVRLMRPFALG